MLTRRVVVYVYTAGRRIGGADVVFAARLRRHGRSDDAVDGQGR